VIPADHCARLPFPARTFRLLESAAWDVLQCASSSVRGCCGRRCRRRGSGGAGPRLNRAAGAGMAVRASAAADDAAAAAAARGGAGAGGGGAGGAAVASDD